MASRVSQYLVRSMDAAVPSGGWNRSGASVRVISGLGRGVRVAAASLEPGDNRRPNLIVGLAPDQQCQMLQPYPGFAGVGNNAEASVRDCVREARHRRRRSDLVGGVDDRKDGEAKAGWA